MSGPEGPAPSALEGYGASSRIRAALPEMPGGMAKVGTLLLTDPALPLRLSITELADRAGTSPATVTRFCRAIGYTGYLALRVGAAAEQGRSSAYETWESDIGRAFHPGDTATEMMRTLVNAHTVALTSTAERLDPALVGQVADALAQSTHVDIYGIGGSAGMAAELQARLYRIGINAHAWSEVHAGLASAVLLSDASVAIAFSNTGRTEETIEMLALAKSSGAYAVAVTSDPASPMAQVADAHLTSHAPGEYLQPDDLSAKHAQLFVIDLLYLLAAQRDFSRTTSLLAASAAAVAPHRRPLRPTTRPRAVPSSKPPQRERTSRELRHGGPPSAPRPRPGGQCRRPRPGHRPHRVLAAARGRPPGLRHRPLAGVRHGDRRSRRWADPDPRHRAARRRPAWQPGCHCAPGRDPRA
jgi:DNA-binding MurR/RpiR family transcriptional regulator